VILTYRYRLLPLKGQHRALERICAAQRELYNAAPEERIDCYRKTGKWFGRLWPCGHMRVRIVGRQSSGTTTRVSTFCAPGLARARLT
jgi:hypothetical protein